MKTKIEIYSDFTVGNYNFKLVLYKSRYKNFNLIFKI